MYTTQHRSGITNPVILTIIVALIYYDVKGAVIKLSIVVILDSPCY